MPASGPHRRRCAGPTFAGALLALALAVAGPGEAWGARRFALLVANNEGGPGTARLRYAHEDAARIRAILTRLGGVAPQDSLLLEDRDAADLRRALDLVEQRIREAASLGEPAILILYYSGHAKDGALRLGRTTIALDELKQRMAASAAEVRIGIFDSCRSGAVTRTKGARKAPAFEVDTGALRAARGLVLLTSSAADEDSQESDQLQGSFFSHHLASALLGGADASGDGRVSLGEAYAYAYERTVADTADTAAGAQHPTYSYDLAGNGDVILTDVLARREGVLIPAEAPGGSWFLVDSRGHVAAEVAKASGVERRVALVPGAYRVRRRLADRLRVGDIRVEPGATVPLDDAALRDAPFSDDPIKGDADYRHAPQARYVLALSGGYQGFFAGPFPSTALFGFEAAIDGSPGPDWALAVDLGLGSGSASIPLDSGALAYRFRELTLGASMTRGWTVGAVSPFVGARLGIISLSRSFDDAAIPSQGYFAMTPGLVGGARLRLSDRWAATGRLRLHYLHYSVEASQSLGYLETALLLSYDL